MYAVIFRAVTRDLDQEYLELAEQLRRLAIDKYGCREFFALTEGNQEVAISYWDTEEQVRNWKQDALHLRAQQLGRKNGTSHIGCKLQKYSASTLALATPSRSPINQET